MRVSTEDVRKFAEKIRFLQRGAGNLSADVRVEVQRIVDEHRRRIKEMIDHYPAKTTLPAGDVPKLSTRIKSEMDAMIEETTSIIQQAQAGIWKKGVEAGREVARGLGLEGMFFTPSTELLSIASSYTADLIRSVSADVMPKLNGALSRGVLGSLTPYETMQELDGLLGRAGQRGVSYQVERIVRTEVQRVYSIALDSEIDLLVRSLYKLRHEGSDVIHPKKLLKQWVAGPWRPGRRDDHQKIDGQQVSVTEDFVLPDGTRLSYPRDPAGPPHQTINCGCSWILVPESLVEAVA